MVHPNLIVDGDPHQEGTFLGFWFSCCFPFLAIIKGHRWNSSQLRQRFGDSHWYKEKMLDLVKWEVFWGGWMWNDWSGNNTGRLHFQGALLGEVENFGNGICGQDENHLSTSSDHGTMARRAKSVPASTKKGIECGTISTVVGTSTVFAGVLRPDLLPKIQEGCKKNGMSSERSSENN